VNVKRPPSLASLHRLRRRSTEIANINLTHDADGGRSGRSSACGGVPVSDRDLLECPQAADFVEEVCGGCRVFDDRKMS
jgi:hypothetical protein